MPRKRVVGKVTRKITITRNITVRTTVTPRITSRTVLPTPSPPVRQIRNVRRTPLSSVPSLVRDEDAGLVPDIESGRIYDVFISHASEDKDDFVRPLAHALRNVGLEVWYDEFELRIGDSLRQKIDRGLASSRTGIVVLSKSFFVKGWTNYELDGIVSKSNSGEQQLLPIWHNISKAELMSYSPSLTDKVARSTLDYTTEEIAAEIADVIQARKADAA